MVDNLPKSETDRKIDQALAFHRQGQLDAAESLYRAVITEDPTSSDAPHLLGLVAFARGDLQAAHTYISAAIKLAPGDERFHLNLANVLRAQGRTDDAIASTERAVEVRTDYVEAWLNRGLLLASVRRFDEAVVCLETAQKIKPDSAEIWLNHGAVLKELGRLEDALASYEKAISLYSSYAEAHSNRGVIFSQLKKYDAALVSFEAALAAKPNYADAHYNRGNALQELKRFSEALIGYDAAIVLSPHNAEYHYNRGVTLGALWRLEEALTSYDRAIASNPTHAPAHNNRGVALYDLRRFDDALKAYNAALVINPDYAEAYNNRGHVLYALKQYPEALESYQNALKLNASIPGLFGAVVNTRLALSDWEGLDDQVALLLASLESGNPTISPFGLLALPSTPAQQLRCAELHSSSRPYVVAAPPKARTKPHDSKIRLGYFSPDFRSHAVSFLTAGLYEQHDRSRFEVYGFSFGVARAHDSMRARLEAGFDSFIDIRGKSDDEVVALARHMGIDVAIDLAGYTLDARAGIFARRAAPVQVNYLGHPGTMGVDFMDYIIADRSVIPEAEYAQYAEKIVLMPNTFQVNDPKRPIAVAQTRALAGLENDAVVFCSFNAAYKLNPKTFNLWLDILKQVPRSVLWLAAESQHQVNNLKTYAQRHGVSAQRIIFAGWVPYAEHLARYQLVDLVLDTLPFNGGTTTSDALWAGAPVLTCHGNTFAGRMAASLLSTLGLEELITTSTKDYRALAIALGLDAERRAEIRQKLAVNRATHPLFDVVTFTSHLEAAYTKMTKLSEMGLPPENLFI